MFSLNSYAANGDQYYFDDVVLIKKALSYNPPAITTQPADKAVLPGQTATFSIVATGNGALSYQWRRNGLNITGATGASYTTAATTLADNGAIFDCVVTDSVGSVARTLLY